MISFDAEHGAVHYPPDRRFRVWIRPSIVLGTCAVIVFLIAAAWVEMAVAGLPHIPPVPQVYPNNFAGPHGFPLWVRYCHFFNFLFVMMLIRSGLSILVDHPRLYFNDGCTPGSEWIRLTPLKVPRDRIWTAKDDARYISPLVGTPGYRHTIGVARVWHFISVHGFIVTGILFVIMLFDTEQWRRLVPTSSVVVLQAWNTWVHYATFHLPAEPNGFYGYNALQQIAYFAVVFLFGFWCKYMREAQQGLRSSKDYAARTALQIAETVWFLRWRRPRANCPLRIRRSSSIPAMVVAAQSKSLKPSIGPVLDLIPR